MPVVENFLTFLDTETTGTKPGWHEVTQVAAILTDMKCEEIARINLKTQINYPDRWDPKAREMNRTYDPEVWAREAVPFYQFKHFLKKHIPYGSVAIPIGHNVEFDRQMIDEGYYKPTNEFCPLALRKIDTVGFALALRIAGVIDVPDVKLATVAKALGIKLENAHDAMEDCEASKQIFERMLLIMKS